MPDTLLAVSTESPRAQGSQPAQSAKPAEETALWSRLKNAGGRSHFSPTAPGAPGRPAPAPLLTEWQGSFLKCLGWEQRGALPALSSPALGLPTHLHSCEKSPCTAAGPSTPEPSSLCSCHIPFDQHVELALDPPPRTAIQCQKQGGGRGLWQGLAALGEDLRSCLGPRVASNKEQGSLLPRE